MQVQPVVLEQTHVPVALAQRHGTLAIAQLLLRLVTSPINEPVIPAVPCLSSMITRSFSKLNLGFSSGLAGAFMFFRKRAYKNIQIKLLHSNCG